MRPGRYLRIPPQLGRGGEVDAHEAGAAGHGEEGSVRTQSQADVRASENIFFERYAN